MKTPQLLLALFVSLTLTACGQNIAEKMTEEMIESAMEQSGNTNANIDLSGGNMNITTEDGSYQLGMNAKWPSNFPNDVYKIDGTVMSSLSESGETAYWVMLNTSKSVEEATTEYKSELEKNGWKMTMTASYGESSTLGAEKDGRQLAVIIASGGDQTSVTISESKQ